MIDKQDDDRKKLEELAKTGENSPRRRMQPVVAGVVGLLVVIAAYVVINLVLLMRVPDRSGEIAGIMKRVRERIDASQKIPAEKNAWIQYEKAMNLMVTPEHAGAQDPRRKESKDAAVLADPDKDRMKTLLTVGISPADLDYVKELKNLNAEALRLVDEGYGKEFFQCPVEYQKGLENFPCDFLKVRALGQLLIVMGDFEVQQGNYREAVLRYQQAQFLGRGIGENTGSLGFGVGKKIEIDSLAHLLDFLNSYDGDKTFFEGVLREQDRLAKGHQTLADTLDTEMVLAESTIDKIEGQGVNPALQTGVRFPAKLMIVLRAKTVMERERKVYENWYLSAVACVNGTITPADLQKMETVMYRNSTVMGMFILNMSLLQRQSASYSALNEGVRAMIALQRYKLDKGQYPEDLKDLVPDYMAELPEDPFSDKGTLRYKKMGDSILLYSLGVDRDDDNGAARAKIDEISGDMVFTDPPEKKK